MKYRYSYSKNLDPKVWGPHFWFVIHTITLTYPEHPNNITKRKYYDFIMNLPLFLPNEKVGNTFASLLDKYPVTPYLDKRETFIKWAWFIHNKVNFLLGKEQIGLYESIDSYYENYNYSSTPSSNTFREKLRGYILLFSILLVCFALIYFHNT